MNEYLGAFAVICACTVVMVAFIVAARIVLDARYWRKFVRAAGGEECAIALIEATRMQRELDDALLRKAFRTAFPNNVIRITNRGRPVKFTPDDAA